MDPKGGSKRVNSKLTSELKVISSLKRPQELKEIMVKKESVI